MSSSDPSAPEIEQISDGLAIMQAIADIPPRQAALEPSLWPVLDFPVIDRGRLAIFPLAIASGGNGDGPGLDRLREVYSRLREDYIHLYGGDHFHAETVLDVEDHEYARKLAEVGALATTPGGVHVWSVRDRAVALVLAIDADRQQATLALHMMPRHWIWYLPLNSGTKREASRHRRGVKEQQAVDVAWSWPASDLVDTGGATGILPA